MKDPKPNLSSAAIKANLEHAQSQRVTAHSEYLKFKREERYWREQLNKITPGDSSVNTGQVPTCFSHSEG